MLVKDYMTRHPIMVEPSRRVVEVQKLMLENNIRHLPVIDNFSLIGVVSIRDISTAFDEEATAGSQSASAA